MARKMGTTHRVPEQKPAHADDTVKVTSAQYPRSTPSNRCNLRYLANLNHHQARSPVRTSGRPCAGPTAARLAPHPQAHQAGPAFAVPTEPTGGAPGLFSIRRLPPRRQATGLPPPKPPTPQLPDARAAARDAGRSIRSERSSTPSAFRQPDSRGRSDSSRKPNASQTSRAIPIRPAATQRRKMGLRRAGASTRSVPGIWF